MLTEAVFENIAERIQMEIRKAERSVFIAVAWFTNRNLFIELLNKVKEGATVNLIISNDGINFNSSIDFELLVTSNSNVYRIGNGDTELMHNKFCVIDYSTVITGSYNWSYKAERNFENVIITSNDTVLAEQFISEFNSIRIKYYPDSKNEEVIFPLEKIIKRLEILKNYILLEDNEQFKSESSKLEKYDFNSDIQEIIGLVRNEEYALSIKKIESFISRNNQLTIWIDTEIVALKFEIKNLENQLNGYDNEKIELEKLLSNFQYCHTNELGDLILGILNLRKLKFKEDDTKYEEAKNNERQYREQVNIEIERKIFNLSDNQKTELKKKFRKATVLCHPDKVDKEYENIAQTIFIALKQAYDANDLEKVTKILRNLEKSNLLKTKLDTVLERDLLKADITNLRCKITIIESEIMAIKKSETYKTIIQIDDWDKYFIKMKALLKREFDELTKETGKFKS